MTTTLSGRPVTGPVDTPPPQVTSRRRKLGWLIYLVLIFFSLIYLYPFLIQIGTSFKFDPDATANPLNPIPQEWTLDAEVRTDAADTINLAPMRRQRMTRGGNWFDTPAASLKDYMATENPRSPRALQLSLGARRALQVPDAGSDAGNGTSTPPSSRNTPLDRSITPPGTLSGYKRTNRAPSRIVAR